MKLPAARTTVHVQRFHYPTQPLEVEIVSSASIGSGLTARIYKGLAGPLGYQYEVALKIIPILDENKQTVLAELIRREVAIVSRLSERAMRRILPFIGIASMQFQMVIASRFMRNGNLLQYFAAKRDADRQRLVIQVAEGVYWLHECNSLVHGDLKCENILVDDWGDAVIADFGLSTLVEQEALSVTTISAIRGMSTLPFAAPELVFPPERANAVERPRSKTRESDVYAFGMLVLQAFTGTRPWPGLTERAVLGRLINSITHPRPSEEATMLGLSNSWWAVCLRCWDEDPQARPTMESVWETLEKKRRMPRTLVSNIAGLSCVTPTPCGKRVISTSTDGSVLVWDTATGNAISGPIRDENARVRYIAISPDGREIFSCGSFWYGTFRRWDTEFGTPISEPMTLPHCMDGSGAISPDGTRIVSWSHHTLRVSDATTGGASWDAADDSDEIWSVAFSPDGVFLASGSRGGAIRLRDSATGATLGVLEHDRQPGEGPSSICFSPDRIHLISGLFGGDIRVWNLSTRQLAFHITAHSMRVSSVAVSPSGRYIASGSSDKSIRIWDARTGNPVGAPLTGHTDSILSIAFLPDGRSLVSGSSDETIRIWDLFD